MESQTNCPYNKSTIENTEGNPSRPYSEYIVLAYVYMYREKNVNGFEKFYFVAMLSRYKVV